MGFYYGLFSVFLYRRQIGLEEKKIESQRMRLITRTAVLKIAEKTLPSPYSPISCWCSKWKKEMLVSKHPLVNEVTDGNK